MTTMAVDPTVAHPMTSYKEVARSCPLLPLIVFFQPYRSTNFASQQILQGNISSINAVKKHVDDLRALYQQIENDYKDIEAAEAANDYVAHKAAIAQLEDHRRHLRSPFYLLAENAIRYYNQYGGKPQRKIV